MATKKPKLKDYENNLKTALGINKKEETEKNKERIDIQNQSKPTDVFFNKTKTSELPRDEKGNVLYSDKPKPKSNKTKVFRDQNGQLSGVEFSDGRVFLGMNALQVQQAINSRNKRTMTPEGAVEVKDFNEQKRQEAIIEQQRQGLVQNEAPIRRELDPTIMSNLETAPVIGGAVSLLNSAIVAPIRRKFGLGVNEFTPEELRTEALSMIEKREISRGLTASEKFGAVIEAIPVVGSLVSKYASGLIETPSSNAREVKDNILKEKRRISNIETNVKMGYLPVVVAQEQIQDIEFNVQRLESRLRLLIQGSPELRFNSDYVNTIETEVLLTREKAFQAKQNILTGAVKDPTQLEMLEKMKELGLTSEEE